MLSSIRHLEDVTIANTYLEITNIILLLLYFLTAISKIYGFNNKVFRKAIYQC